MVEIFKATSKLNPTFMKNIFTDRDVQYNLKSRNHLQLPNIRTIIYGIENIQYIGHYLWTSLLDEIKDLGTLINFKQKIKSWKGMYLHLQNVQNYCQWSRVSVVSFL